MGMTVVEKILARAAGQPGVWAGEVVEPAASAGDVLKIHADSVLNRTNGRRFAVRPLPPARQAIMKAGGPIANSRRRLLTRQP